MLRAFVTALAFTLSLDAFAGSGRIIIVNSDSAGAGFNDPTPAPPVGGNAGTTLGAQRLNVFNAAAEVWSRAIDINVDVLVTATFSRIAGCTATTGVLGQAGPSSWVRDFANAPRANTWYPIGLANNFAGKDLSPTGRDIFAQFNSDVDNATCLGASNWYYGFDGKAGNHINLFVVVLHELAHGLGVTAASSAPSFRDGYPSIGDIYRLDVSTGKHWHQMTQDERSASMLNTSRLVWDGPQVTARTKMFLQAVTMLSITEPSSLARNYDLGTASFGAAPHTLTGRVVRAIDAANDEAASASDGCSALTNASEIAGNVALIDRGGCTFSQKARNAQAAGASAVIIVDNKRETCLPPSMSGDGPDVTIPVVSVTQDDGDKLKGELAKSANVRGFTRTDPSQLAGTSSEGFVRIYAPCTNEPGSSIHHWDTPATPNLLMEPSVNADLLHGLDLTLYQLLDIGWNLPPRSGRTILKR